MEAIKTVVAGTGFGCRVHVPALRAAGFEVVGLVGTRPDKLARKAQDCAIPAYFTDLGEAIDATGAKAVTIATTPATHFGLTMTALERGCHVICEKPFASDAAEGAELLNAAEAAGSVHMVAHEFRWLPERALFGRAIAEGLIGEPRFLVIDQFLPLVADPEARMPKWWFDKASGGGWLGAGGSHLLDQVRAWFGEVDAISARLLTVSDRQDAADDTYSLRFTTKSGVECSMQQSAGTWGPMATLWRCAGSHGTVWIESGKVMLADKAGTRELPVPEDLQLPPPPSADPASDKRHLSFELGPFVRLCEAFRSRIEGKAPANAIALPTFHDGLAGMQIMDAIRSSSDAGGVLKFVGDAGVAST